MKRTWMLLSISILLFSTSFAQDDATDYYRNDGLELSGPEQETTAPEVSLRPQRKPRPKPRVTVESATPNDSTMRRNPDIKFTNTGRYDRQTAFLKKFQHVFKKCSGGCDAGRAHIHRARPLKRSQWEQC